MAQPDDSPSPDPNLRFETPEEAADSAKDVVAQVPRLRGGKANRRGDQQWHIPAEHAPGDTDELTWAKTDNMVLLYQPRGQEDEGHLLCISQSPAGVLFAKSIMTFSSEGDSTTTEQQVIIAGGGVIRANSTTTHFSDASPNPTAVEPPILLSEAQVRALCAEATTSIYKAIQQLPYQATAVE